MDAHAFAQEKDVDDLKLMLQEWRTARGANATVGQPDSRFDQKEPELVVLMDSLESGQTVKARVMEPRAKRYEIQMVTALGIPSGGYIRFGWRQSSTSDIVYTPNIYPLIDTAATIQNYMAELPGLGRGNIRVNLGTLQTTEGRTVVSHKMWRWQFEFIGTWEGRDPELIVVDSHLTNAYATTEQAIDWVDSGRMIDVHCAIPCPYPTPMRAGAFAWAQWKRRAGYCVIACEPRDFGDYGLFF